METPTATAPKTRPKATPNLKRGARPVRTLTTPVYAFKDLAGKAREKALDWLRSCVAEDPNSLDGWQETVKTDLEALGFTLGTMHAGKRPAIFWSLSYCQGDGVAFEGSADLATLLEKATAQAVKAHAPNGDLPALPADLETAARALLALDNHGTTATLNVSNPGRYFNTDSDLSVDRADLSGPCPAVASAGGFCPHATGCPGDQPETAARALEETIKEGLAEWVRDLCAAFETSGYKEREYQEGDEALAESMEANGYTFTEDGKREG